MVVLAFVRRLRPQWGLTDCLLLGAALGAGFALVESLLRGTVVHGDAGDTTGGLGSGWDVAAGMSTQHIPGFGEALKTWLPAPPSARGRPGRPDSPRCQRYRRWPGSPR